MPVSEDRQPEDGAGLVLPREKAQSVAKERDSKTAGKSSIEASRIREVPKLLDPFLLPIQELLYKVVSSENKLTLFGELLDVSMVWGAELQMRDGRKEDVPGKMQSLPLKWGDRCFMEMR